MKTFLATINENNIDSIRLVHVNALHKPEAHEVCEALKIPSSSARVMLEEVNPINVVVVQTTPRYDHMYTVAWSVKTENDADHVTSAEILAGLRARVAEIEAIPDGIEQCIGGPDDTSDNYPEEGQ